MDTHKLDVAGISMFDRVDAGSHDYRIRVVITVVLGTGTVATTGAVLNAQVLGVTQ